MISAFRPAEFTKYMLAIGVKGGHIAPWNALFSTKNIYNTP